MAEWRRSGRGELRLVVLGELAAAFLGAVAGDLLAVAGSVDVDADGVHGEAVEDSGGQGGVAEVAAPAAELDIRRDRCRGLGVTPVDQIEERVRGGRLVLALL